MLSRTLLIILVTICSFAARANTLPERLDQFGTMFNVEQALANYDIRIIQSEFPNRLIDPSYMQPQTSSYPLKDIQKLYQLSESCTGQLPVSPLVTEPLVFVRALCKGNQLSERWFARSNMIHPGGGSYAYRYTQVYPERYSQLERFMHIKERPIADPNTLLGRMQEMTPNVVQALLRGDSMMLEEDELWLKKGDIYYVYEPSVWKAHAEQVGLIYSVTNKRGECLVQRGNICWSVQDHSEILQGVMIGLGIANIMLVCGWLYYRWDSKRKELKSRMLVLQILTHELRTPIASLSLTVEGFRREFENLPESVYDEFRRLCEDSRRLRQLAEASKDYLQSDYQPLATEWVPSIEEWLTYKLEEEFSQSIEFNLNRDVAAKLNVYWLGTCIDNLIRNALKYGVAPVTLNIEVTDSGLLIKVIDQGQLGQKDWNNLRKPFVSQAGLGLGLTIVESMVAKMGGNMKLVGPPTTFILEIPCETDTASR
ncbi:sensor histidine kinase VxrA [Vibrio sp. WXL103]|uniref:sensor histidine kinase VxrA n=1 Tax=unclassified Vibrio TaxID=2614977 RepID=UPI003EC6FDD2